MEIEILLLLVMLAFSALFSAAEAALLTISRIKIRNMLKKHPKDSRLQSLVRLKKNTPHTIMAILVGNNVANVSASFLAAHITTLYFGDIYLGLATGIMTLVILVFAEVIPKNYATLNSQKFALACAKPVEFLSGALFPVIFALERISAAVPGAYALGGRKVYFSEEEIRSAIDLGVEDKAITSDEKVLIERVLDFNDTYVKEIMTPARDVKMMNSSDSREEALKKAAKFRKNRYPVLNAQGKVAGMVSLKKIICMAHGAKVEDVMLPPLFVSPESVATELFKNLQKGRRQLAIVLNSAGAMEGIITMEDLVEEIVGEIEESPHHIKREEIAKLVVSGDARLHDVEKELGMHIPSSERFGSVGAFLHYQLKRLPVRGDIILFGGCRWQVRDVSPDYSMQKIEIKKI